MCRRSGLDRTLTLGLFCVESPHGSSAKLIETSFASTFLLLLLLLSSGSSWILAKVLLSCRRFLLPPPDLPPGLESSVFTSAGCYYRPDPDEGPKQLKVSMTTLPEGVLPSLLSMETNIFNTKVYTKVPSHCCSWIYAFSYVNMGGNLPPKTSPQPAGTALAKAQ